MAVYIKIRPTKLLSDEVNYLEDIEGGMVIPTTMEMDKGRYVPYRQYGLAIPKKLVRECLLRIQKHELDEVGHRG
jgi:hypothetical protein